MSTFDVQIWGIVHRPSRGSKPYRLRWKVGAARFEKYYRTKALADSERGRLLRAARTGEAFDEKTGQPITDVRAESDVSWYEHAREYALMKWPSLAPNSRRSTVEALTAVTVALVSSPRARPSDAVLRRAVYSFALNAGRRDSVVPDDETAALAWLGKASVPLRDLAEPAIVRRALAACAVKLDGRPAAATTIARKRAVLYNALGYAVELRRLSANPIDTVQWRAPGVAEAVDNRAVANPAQVQAIFDAVRGLGEHGARLLAFFGCIYYTGGRPSEVAYLMRRDCVLPESGWGRVTYAETQPRSGSAWTDDGTPREVRGLKHRPRKAVRPVPAPPELVRMLREHIDRFGVADDGRIFQSARGNPISDSSYARVWKAARASALTADQVASPLARRPYDLRHACASLWLNAGVAPTRVAQRLGHSVAVLLRVYANCIDGDDELMNERIEAVLP